MADIKKTIEKISNGDARFKRLADTDIPEFSAVRKGFVMTHPLFYFKLLISLIIINIPI